MTPALAFWHDGTHAAAVLNCASSARAYEIRFRYNVVRLYWTIIYCHVVADYLRPSSNWCIVRYNLDVVFIFATVFYGITCWLQNRFYWLLVPLSMRPILIIYFSTVRLTVANHCKSCTKKFMWAREWPRLPVLSPWACLLLNVIY